MADRVKRMERPYLMARPDPRVRYLAHRETQPVDSWARDLSLVLFSIALLLLIAGLAVVVR